MTVLKTLRLLAILEGISYILFGLTMPMKYIWEIKEPNYYVGMIHGVLFILYCIYVLLAAKKYSWNFLKTFIIGFASLIPFGTFWADAKYLKLQNEANKTA